MGNIILLICLMSVSINSYANASGPIDATDIRYWSYPDYTRVAVTLSDNPEFTKNRLSNPDRIYFDIKNSHIKKEVKTSLPVGNGMLKFIRASQFNDSTVRSVLDLEKVNDYKVIILEDPVRMIIDIYGNEAVSPVPAVSSYKKKRIVIGPGHGGHDPGAVGPNKLYEKDFVLDIALKLKKILS